MKVDMAKRSAATDLNCDNWDDEEEYEEPGSFREAPVEVVQKRIIKIAKRRIPQSSDGEDTKNVFSGFGFNSTPSEKVKSGWSFTSNNKPMTNGSQQSSVESANKSFYTTGHQPLNMGESDIKIPSKKNVEESSPENIYLAKLKTLNENVSHWIKSHVDRNPCIILTPIFQDYEKHLKEIQESNSEINCTNSNNKAQTQMRPIVNGTLSESVPSVMSAFVGSEKCTVGNSQMPTTQTAGLFSSIKMDSTSSLLENKSNPSSLMVNPFLPTLNKKSGCLSAGLSYTSEVPQGFSIPSKPFSFGNLTTESASLVAHKEDGDVDKSDEPPIPFFTPVQEDGAVYSKRCKVFVKKEGTFSDRGVGTLFIKPVSGGTKNQLIVRADTSLGNVLLNVLLGKSLPLQRTGKNNVMLVCLPTPDITPPSPTPVLLRVKTETEADELLQTLQEHTK